ncbi:hypothetical protein PIB30_116629 [Stylosanthes scabra]|uniref:Retrotransposon gag domain-containing protein n=1 Tax=Stylosanthes scabra TaxID=79078 RepID=A0ABU6YPQ6_9FABA|nr:hypothetical protein [Stylosanthes scabra]
MIEARLPQELRRNSAEQWRKLEFPLFRGDDTAIWIERMEQFFLPRAVPEEDWIDVATYAMEGRAFTWFRWWELTAPNHDWQSLSSALLRHFQPDRLQNPNQLLLRLRQTGSVREFIDQFLLHARHLRGTAPDLLTDLFLNGLKLEISEECKLFEYRSVDELMELAQKIENRNAGLRGFPIRCEGKPPMPTFAAGKASAAASGSSSSQVANVEHDKGA